MKNTKIVRNAKHPLLIINLKGSQVEMGSQYGEIISAQGGHRTLFDFYPKMAQHLLFQGLPRSYRKNWLSKLVSGPIEFGMLNLHRRRPGCCYFYLLVQTSWSAPVSFCKTL